MAGFHAAILGLPAMESRFADTESLKHYLYHPDQPNATGEDLRYDDSSNGDWELFESGRWYHIRHRVVMNTVVDGVGQHDGIVQGWLDGELVFDVQNIRFRDVTTFAVDGFHFSTFFGGTGTRWNTSKDEVAFFDDFLITVPDGAVPEPPMGSFVALQAEDFSAATDPNGDGDTWQIFSDDDAHGGQSITTDSDSRTNVPEQPHDALAIYTHSPSTTSSCLRRERTPHTSVPLE